MFWNFLLLALVFREFQPENKKADTNVITLLLKNVNNVEELRNGKASLPRRPYLIPETPSMRLKPQQLLEHYDHVVIMQSCSRSRFMFTAERLITKVF